MLIVRVQNCECLSSAVDHYVARTYSKWLFIKSVLTLHISSRCHPEYGTRKTNAASATVQKLKRALPGGAMDNKLRDE